jgi:hypothetical protein
MEMEWRESEAIVRIRHAILDRITLLEKGIKFQTLSDSCEHR